VLGLYPLLPDKMDVQRDDCGNIYYVYSRNSDENPMFKEYGDIRLKAEEVLHIPGLGFDGLIGYSPIAMAKNAVGMTLACEEYGASFFANGANPGGVLEHPGVLKDPSKVRESWNSVYRGVNNAHKIAVLEEGMKYQQIGIPPEEAQFLETRKFQINEIARLYRIPPHMVGDLDKSSFSNIEQQSLEFVKYTLDPWVIRWEQSLQRSLLLPGEKGKYFIKLNVDGLLRGDYQSRMNGYAVGRQNGWFSANDIREMENGYELVVDLPGFTKDEVQATLENGYLTISAEKGLDKDEKEKENGRYIRRERYAGACSRSFYVGEDITEEDIKAEFKHGLLKLFVPKKEAKPAVEQKKTISIEG